MSWKSLAFGGSDVAAAAGPSLDSNLDQYGDVIGTFGDDGTFAVDGARAAAAEAEEEEPEEEFVPLQMALAQVVDYLKERLLSFGGAYEEDDAEGGAGGGAGGGGGDGGGDRKPLTVEDIYDGSGIDLGQRTDVVAQLKKNEHVIVTSVDADAEAADGGDIAAAAHAASRSKAKQRGAGRMVEMFRYKPKANVKTILELERLVNRCPNGLPVLEIDDAYAGVGEDWRRLVEEGRVIGVKSAETNTVVMFPRGPCFLAQLSCPVHVDPGASRVYTNGRDVTAELRRGDALVLDGGTYRVAYETKGTKNPDVLSVSSTKDLSARARWATDFDDPAGGVPLNEGFDPEKGGEKATVCREAAAAAASGSGPKGGAGIKMAAHKHGCSNDIRQMWKATVAGWPADERQLNKEMLRNGLMTQEQYMAIANPVNKRHLKGNASLNKVKKRRYRKKKVKISTNSHLHGTEVGREIERQSKMMGEGN
jgi:hypothetical protein